MVDVRGGEENARDRVKQLFQTKQVNGRRVDIRAEQGRRWQSPESASWYGIPNGSSTKFAVAQATVDVDDWLRLQASVYNRTLDTPAIDEWLDCFENDDLPMGHPFLDGAKEPTVEATADTPTAMPEPVLELERKTESPSVSVQEGRSRGLGAKLAGLDRIPIWVAARRDRT